VTAPPGVIQGLNFRVRQPGAMMPALPDNFASSNQDRPHHRVWRRAAEPAPRELKGLPHVFGTGSHEAAAKSGTFE
jgi:acyl-CoA thioesterase